MIVKLLTEHHLEFLSLKGGCRGSSESTLVKMSNCWKSHVTAYGIFAISTNISRACSFVQHQLDTGICGSNRSNEHVFLSLNRSLSVWIGMGGGGVWYSLFNKNGAYCSSH